MTETIDIGRIGPELKPADMAHAVSEVDVWFAREVLPLEAAIMQFLRRNWRNSSETGDLLQEIYANVYEAALKQIPESAKPFVFTTARNLLISLVRREQVVPIETVADLEALMVSADEPGPDRAAIARDELRRLQEALKLLPRRSQEAFMLRHIDGLSRQEIASRMGVAEQTVKWHLSEGLRILADVLYGSHSDIRRRA
jgi:RNA polymerase sigma factor (sigma-70 family)